MISAEELRNIAKIKGINNIGHAEKDYIMELILLLISRNTKDELIFKGGTCLYKFYKLARFSEDIDFTLRKEIDIDSLLKAIASGLARFGAEAKIKETKKANNSIMAAIKVKGILFKNTSQSFCNIRLDINMKSSIETEPVNAVYSPIYKDIPSFSLLIMDEKEILAEKVRALVTRNKARDAYDLWFLLEKGIKADKHLIKNKLTYYGITFTVAELKKAVAAKAKMWEKELAPLVFTALPPFLDCKKRILKEFGT